MLSDLLDFQNLEPGTEFRFTLPAPRVPPLGAVPAKALEPVATASPSPETR